MSEQRVEFRAEDGIPLVGILRRPEHARGAIALTGPFTGVKEQVVGGYAEGLAEAGFATLAFDHRNFGESGGAVRWHEDAAGKLADLRAAVGYLRGNGFDRVGLAGICLGGGYALRAAAQDPRVTAVACVASTFPGAPIAFANRGTDYRGALHGPLHEGWTDDGEPVYQPAISPTEESVGMPGTEPFAYYGTSRGHTPNWHNQVTVASKYQWLTVDTMSAADLISPTPLLIVHGQVDDYCSPDDAQAVYDRAGEPKKLVWLPTTNHIDLYDVPEYVEPALGELADFFHSYLCW